MRYLCFWFLDKIFYNRDLTTSYEKYPCRVTFFKKLDIYFIKFYELPFEMLRRVNFRLNSKIYKNFFLGGYVFLVRHLCLWVVPLLVFVLFLYFSLFIRSISLFKVVLEWFLVLNIFYWLIAGFVFFIKKYKFNRFTSAIQRFWRRSFIIFWLIESSLFIVFIYLLLNASQEPVFAFDFIQLNKFRLYSWKLFLFKSFFVVVILVLSYILLLSIKWNSYTKYSSFLVVITILLTYVVWLEFYQFFYTINWYGEIVWIFDADDKVWYAESVFKRARILNHYVTICIIAKFWHIIYIYIFWVFFILRSLEQKKISYIMLSANFQNFLILYIMNWLLVYPWLKFVFRKFLTYNHSSFKEFREYMVSGLYTDLFIFYKNALNFAPFFNFFKKTDFFFALSMNFGVHSYNKDFIKPQLVELFLFIIILVFCSIWLCVFSCILLRI